MNHLETIQSGFAELRALFASKTVSLNNRALQAAMDYVAGLGGGISFQQSNDVLINE